MTPARLLSALAAALLLAPPLAGATDGPRREWNFDVSVDGRHIGQHRFTLREHGEVRELTSEAEFRVRFVFIEAYRYTHRARELWQGDCLESLDARTDANGKPTLVEGRRDGAAFRIQSGSAQVVQAACVQTFAYWNPDILDARRLLNPQTGEYVDVKVLLMGPEVVDGQQTRRYRLLGGGRVPLEIDLWYTATGDWLALESLTPEGRRLRYARK